MSIKLGIIGGGQLAWMMADAVNKLGVKLIVQTPSQNDPAVSIAQDSIFAPINDAAATEILAQKCDIITFENEFVNLAALSLLEKKGVCFRPQLSALAPVLDKYEQRCYFKELGLPVPEFLALSREQEIELEIANFGFPIVLKARRHGYDGQGTFIIRDIATLSKIINQSQTQFLVEEFVPFQRELAIIAARSVNGEIVIYPTVETFQENQVCRWVIAPAKISQEQSLEIEAIAHKLLNSLQYVGILGIELFLKADGTILVNEIAPRTHNSGHFTLDACTTSQFEQHLRAVCGLPLTNTTLNCHSAVMVNLLGYEISQSDYQKQRQQLADIPQATVHWYGKTESRPGRKLGHITVLSDQDNRNTVKGIIHQIESIWYPPEKICENFPK
ncbi:MAG: 5-(carboxyamino)imidazole ribonucleotide synthase [Cuspidothrix sp.]|jgi:5-(carboxyamino)imidazole ribonucleotide synthase